MRIRLHLLKRMRFWSQYLAFKRQHGKQGSPFPFGKLYPCLHDNDDQSGSASGHYFHQDFLVARRIFVNKPERHVDIGSRIDGFVAHVACFREIEVLDVRPLSQRIPNVIFKQADIMDPGCGLENYCDSLSSLHALEHFGLGRYGDRLDVNGHLKGLENISRMLKPGGKLYLSVPIGEQRVEFNAHRVFSVAYLLDLLNKNFVPKSFSYVDDDDDLHEDVDLKDDGIKNNYGCRYGCGIFEMKKVS